MAVADETRDAGGMRPETEETDGPLRTGLTTGVCATAAAVTAARLALGGQVVDPVPVTLPRGEAVTQPLCDAVTATDGAEAGTIKDAGDDPDATHGARVWVHVAPTAAPGVSFHAGTGVGTVTRPEYSGAAFRYTSYRKRLPLTSSW